MSATSQPDTNVAAQAASTNGGSLSGGGGLSPASPRETAEVLLLGIVPALVRGLFSPRRSAMKALTRIDADRRAVKALTAIRRNHDGEGITLLGGKIAVLWGTSAIREVLDRSAELYASDGGAKAKGMSHFQPDAVTLSRGQTWENRRAFNEAVLGSQERAHPQASRMLRVVAEEVGSLPETGQLTYEDWQRLFDHITLRIIFGDRSRSREEITERLEQLMGEANRLVGLSHNDAYYEFYASLERELADPDPESLLGLFAGAPHDDMTRTIQQIPHWIFAMRDTLAMNAFRALAVIAADPSVRSRVESELSDGDLSDPEAVVGMTYVRGCLQEAMRLWPTTPLLARETMQETTLAGERLEEGAQVMLLNVFNHRDPDHVEGADHFQPERWSGSERDYRFNHLSNGSQDCPGGGLVLLLGAAVIGRTLGRFELTLTHPQLPAGGTMPYMLDFYAERFTTKARTR